MSEYPGLHEYTGANGRYYVDRNQDELVIDVYLRSVPSFIQSGQAWSLTDVADRSDPDISFRVHNDEDYWSVFSMEVPSFGLDGVNEFVSALSQNEVDLTEVDELLATIRTLLDQRDAIWGTVPSDIELRWSLDTIGTRSGNYHPGI